MTKEQLQEIVNKNNRPIKNQRDLNINKTLLHLVFNVCKCEKWNPTDFFQGGENHAGQNNIEPENIGYAAARR